MVRIGEKLEQLRIEKKVSVNKLSEELHISRTGYTQMSRGLVYFNILSLINMLTYFNTDLEKFFTDINRNN
jgi:transcriptional regulator with XRE-family HTH domain